MNSINVFLLLWQTQRKLDLVNTLEKPGTPDTAVKKGKPTCPYIRRNNKNTSYLKQK